MTPVATKGHDIDIVRKPKGFAAWEDLRDLLARSFAYMDGRIDPPSSLAAMTAADLERKSRQETLLLALDGGRIAGCVFLRDDPDAVYIGKLAVDAPYRYHGLARRFMERAEDAARQAVKPWLELQTRVELVENHEAFGRLGFSITGYTAHPGFSRPTSLTMRRPVAAGATAGSLSQMAVPGLIPVKQ